MDVRETSTPVVTYVSGLAGGVFTLVDIGCSGGIHPMWRRLGGRLRAIAVDPNVAEIERLTREQPHPHITYLAAFAGLPPGHPFVDKKRGRPDWSRNPWHRLSVARSQEALRLRQQSSSERTAANLWQEVQLAGPSEVVAIPDYLRDRGVKSVDFLKIDVDGKDFEVLQSFDSALESLAVLGLSLEVNFFGSVLETDHTFHNTDRFMKERGFELFDLSVRRYSTAALPSRYVYHLPSATEFGRIVQGDALYVRDLASPEHHDIAARLSPEKLLNLVCVFSLFGLPDCAAELAVVHHEQLSSTCDVDRLLDLLALQAQPGNEDALSYRQWSARFQAEDELFYPARRRQGGGGGREARFGRSSGAASRLAAIWRRIRDRRGR